MTTYPPTAPASGRWQFSLRTLFLVVTFIAVECALLANGAKYLMAGTIVAVLGLPVVGRLSNYGDINFWRGFFVAGFLSYWLFVGWWDSSGFDAGNDWLSDSIIVAGCMSILLVAFFGGLLARYFYPTRTDES